jgi:hypothetical protein
MMFYLRLLGVKRTAIHELPSTQESFPLEQVDDMILQAEKRVITVYSVLRGVSRFLGGSLALVVSRPRDNSRAGC